MKALRFSDSQKALILKQGCGWDAVADRGEEPEVVNEEAEVDLPLN